MAERFDVLCDIEDGILYMLRFVLNKNELDTFIQVFIVTDNQESARVNWLFVIFARMGYFPYDRMRKKAFNHRVNPGKMVAQIDMIK